MKKSLGLSLVAFTMALTLVFTGAAVAENSINNGHMVAHDGLSNDVEKA